MINQELQAKKMSSETNTVIYEDMENFAPKIIFGETIQTNEREKPANAYTLIPSTHKRQGAELDKNTPNRRCNVSMENSVQLANAGMHSLEKKPEKLCYEKEDKNVRTAVTESECEEHVYQELADIQVYVAKKAKEDSTQSSGIYENTSALQKCCRPCGTKRSQSVGYLNGTGWDATSTSNFFIKGKWSSSQTRKLNGPPVPPPRTSSIKRDPGKSLEEGNCGKNTYNEKTKASDISGCGKYFGARHRSLSVPLLEEFNTFSIKNAANTNEVCAKEDGQTMREGSKALHEEEIGKMKESSPVNSTRNPVKTTNKEIKPQIKSKPSKTPPLKPQRSKSLKENAQKLSINTQKTNHVENLFEIPNDLRFLSVSGVCDCLKILNMDSLVGKFQHHLIDGEILKELTKDTMIDMGIDTLNTIILLKFINGWRPRL